MAGNPFCSKENDYKDRLILNLPDVKYIDYIYINESDRLKIKV